MEVFHDTATECHVTCPMGSHSVTCYPTQVNTPRLNPSHTGRYSIYLPGGMEGRVDLVDMIAPRLGVELALSWWLHWLSVGLVIERSQV